MRRSLGSCGAVVLAVLAAGPVVDAADVPKPRARQLEYDADTGQWLEAEPPVPGTPEGDLSLARRDLAREKYRRAHSRIKKWLKAYSPEEALYADALLLRAEVEIARGDYYKALKHLEEFLDQYGHTELAPRARTFEFLVAEVFLSGKRRKWLGMRLFKATDKGVEVLDELSAAFPESELAEEALKTKADFYFRQGDFTLAEMEYARLVDDHPRGQWTRYAMRRSAEAALASFGGIDFDDAPLIEAEERFGLYLAQYPGSAEQEGIGQILQQIHAQRAAKECSVGNYYARTGHPRAAAFYYRSTFQNWPATIAATEARRGLTRLGEADERPEGEPPTETTAESNS
ncbi:MAG: outer membrane protein assembly factor BamD [Planctomycetes bacterium]|nr:outer membrane protein assembly factor BamD [Planctomycetota bacterium]